MQLCWGFRRGHASITGIQPQDLFRALGAVDAAEGALRTTGFAHKQHKEA